MRWVYHDGGRAAVGRIGKTGDCVTRAIALATGRAYQLVYDDLNQRERLRQRRTVKRGSARTGINKDVIREYLTGLGWRWTPTMQIGQGCTVHLTDEEIPMRGRLIVSVSKHLTAVIDGVIYDTHDPQRAGTRCVYGYWQEPS